MKETHENPSSPSAGAAGSEILDARRHSRTLKEFFSPIVRDELKPLVRTAIVLGEEVDRLREELRRIQSFPVRSDGGPVRELQTESSLAQAPGSPLSCWSTHALLEELKRREETARPRSQIVPCDECRHFHSRENPDADYNPCDKGHRMLFRVPESESDRNWGFYRPRCRDRKRVDLPANDKLSHGHPTTQKDTI